MLLASLPGQLRPALAISDTVVISQVYGGGGNSGATYTHDFIELFNRGTTTVDLAGWSVQYASATGTGNFGATAAQITELEGSMIPGQYLLIQGASGGATGSALPTPDIVDISPINMSSTAGKVALVSSNTSLGCNGGSTPCNTEQLALIVDLVGFGSANFFEGSGPAPALSNATAALRLENGAQDTDDNAADFIVGAPNPRNSSFGVPDQAPYIASTNPLHGAVEVVVTPDINITFSEPVFFDDPWFDITCTLSGNLSATVTGGPETWTLYPGSDLLYGEICTITIYASQVRDIDIDDPPDNMENNYTFSFSTMAVNVCEADYTPIYEIQGDGLLTPMPGSVSTKGVVVGDYEGPSPNLGGYYIQDPAGDGNPATSDGIFVFNGDNNSVVLGDLVWVAGTAVE
jgi:predicted extracellular nuclease